MTHTINSKRLETLGVITRILGRNRGLNPEEVNELETAAVKRGITLRTSRMSIAQMIQSEISLDHLEELADFAIDAAKRMDQSVDDTLCQAINTISSGNVRMAKMLDLDLAKYHRSNRPTP